MASVASSSTGSESPDVHEAAWEPDLAVGVARQHWAAPYDDSYLVVTFPADAQATVLDVVALSSREDLAFDELELAETGDVLQVVYPSALQHEPWLTAISVPEATASTAVHLHYFYSAKGRPGEAAVVQRVARRQVLAAGTDVPLVANPHNEGGVAQVPHPAISPSPALLEAADAAGAGGRRDASAALPYERLFLSLAPEEAVSPWSSNVVLNVEWSQANPPQLFDYVALVGHYPVGPGDYMWAAFAGTGRSSYTSDRTCNTGAPIVADLAKLEQCYIFYVGAVNGTVSILGDPVPFKTQRQWMTQSLPDIGQKRLHEIVLPGAHDAGTYDLKSPGYALNAQAQNLDFDGQLALGIRYLDCRLEYFPNDPSGQPFWFYHGAAQAFTEITDLLRALRSLFASADCKDVVILDFCRPKGSWTPSAYDDLFNLFTGDELLAPAMLTPEEAAHLTINELVARGRRLYLLCETSRNAASTTSAGRSTATSSGRRSTTCPT
jgi:hypothetical protein